MADTNFLQPSLEPEFKQALERFNTSIKTLTDEAQALSKAANPLQSLMQVGQQTLDFYAGLDWAKIYANAAKPNYFFEYVESMADIQNEASTRLSNGQQALLDTLLKDGQNIANSAVNASSPEQALAKYINSSLNAFEDIKASLSNQAQTFSSIQAAWLALYQQSLSELSAKAAPHGENAEPPQLEIVTPTYD